MRKFTSHLAVYAVLTLPLIAPCVRGWADGATPTAQTDELATHFKKANEAGERKDWDAALIELDAIIALDSKNVGAYEGKSVVLLQKQDYKGALSALDKLIELDPQRVNAYQVRSSLHQRLGENDAANADYKKVLQLSSEERDNLRGVAQKAIDAKDWQKAYSLWALYADALPADPQGHYGAGMALEGSVDIFDYVTAGEARKAAYDKVFAEAKAQFDAAIQADPKFLPAYLARINKRVGTLSRAETQQALALLNKGIEAVPNSDALYVARADILQGGDADDLKKKIDDYSQAIRLNPKSFDALAGRAWAYHFDKKDTLALADINQALTLQPENTKALVYRAQIAESLGQWERSVADYGKAYSLDSTNTLWAFSHYLALTHLPDTKPALDAISELIAKKPKETLYLQARAELNLTRRDYAQAQADVDAALALQPEDSNLAQLKTRILEAKKTK